MRRAAHSAGQSWRKWEEPLMYGLLREDDPVVTPRALVFWAFCTAAGFIAGALVAISA